MHWFNAHNLRRSFLLHSGMKLFVQTQCCTVLLLPGRDCTFVSRDEAICIWEPRIGRDGGRLACWSYLVHSLHFLHDGRAEYNCTVELLLPDPRVPFHAYLWICIYLFVYLCICVFVYMCICVYLCIIFVQLYSGALDCESLPAYRCTFLTAPGGHKHKWHISNP